MSQKKKILDIFPPQERGRFAPSDTAEEGRRKKDTSFPPSRVREGRFSRKVFIIGGIAALVLIFAGGMYMKLLRVEITVAPLQEEWEFQEEITVLSGASTISEGERALRGRIIGISKDITRQFSASEIATQEERAKGTIRVYNNYHLPQTLVATTRFLSDESKLFRSTRRVSIPSGEYIDVEVQAAEPGEEYNINPSTFSVPGLAGSSRYTAVYGESFEPMTGGSVKEAPQVTEEDIENAKQELSEALIAEGKKQILAQTEDEEGTVFLEGAFRHEIGELVPLVSAGASVEQFQVRGEAEFRAFVFQKQELYVLLEELVSSQVGTKKEIYEKSMVVDFSSANPAWEEGRMILTVSGTVSVYETPDKDSLKSKLGGKTPEEGRALLESQRAIRSARIRFWPLPGRRIPEDPERIRVDITLDPVK